MNIFSIFEHMFSFAPRSLASWYHPRSQRGEEDPPLFTVILLDPQNMSPGVFFYCSFLLFDRYKFLFVFFMAKLVYVSIILLGSSHFHG